MRRIEREGLAPEIEDALRKFQANADELQTAGTLDINRHWQLNRRSAAILSALIVLKRMAGRRERCMYCVDSLGSDIEHFWPKGPYPERMYAWRNLLIACTQCGRHKKDQFPLDAEVSPLLVDPASEDPWDFLGFDPDTGNLNARFLQELGRFSLKGETTVSVLHLAEREGISAGYRKTYRRLCNLVGGWDDGRIPDDFIEQLQEADDHGLLGWFMRPPGEDEPNFKRFREENQAKWRLCQNQFA
jgi:uncharacterized protein (TIGR02646 family)